MSNIHTLFVESDQDVIRCATIERGRNTLCWYPSAASDFRHIRMLEEQRLNNSETIQPLVYFHTDATLPKISNGASDFRLLTPGDQIGSGMRVAQITEIHPKNIIKEVSSDVLVWPADENTGRVFFIDVELDVLHRENTIHLTIPVLYFIVENLSFLVHLILRHQMHVNTLIHIKDGGGSMGGSHIPMNFIYQAAALLNLKRVICDESPDTKAFNTRTDFSVLMHTFMRCERHEDRYLSRMFHEHLREIPEEYVRRAWVGKRIDKAILSPNEFSPPDGYYYDWLPREDQESEHVPPDGRGEAPRR